MNTDLVDIFFFILILQNPKNIKVFRMNLIYSTSESSSISEHISIVHPILSTIHIFIYVNITNSLQKIKKKN